MMKPLLLHCWHRIGQLPQFWKVFGNNKESQFSYIMSNYNEHQIGPWRRKYIIKYRHKKGENIAQSLALADVEWLGTDCEFKTQTNKWKSDSVQHVKKQRHNFADKDPSSQGYGFSSSHVWMWELDHKEGWQMKNWWFWTVVLEKDSWEFLGLQGNQTSQS